MIWIALAGVSAALAALPALLFLANLRLYRPPLAPAGNVPAVSVLIPARNEEASIAACVEAALASTGIDLEVVVLDDHSEDRTSEIVRQIAIRDPRVRLIEGPPLPDGWCGKQHACWVLAQSARHPLLAFLDADVRLASQGLARLAGFLEQSRADLVSGVPHQQTGTWLEKLLIPLIHFVLLGFLPLGMMRKRCDPSLGAGCGQLFLARRDAYMEMGGHSVIRTTLHDGLKLPRAFRAAGKWTDLCDATDLAECRMYRSAAQVWRGLAKNATEGLASPTMIVPATLLLGGGQVLPIVLLGCAAWMPEAAIALAAVGSVLAYLPRLTAAVVFRQSWLGALLHPLGVLLLLAVQWYALGRSLIGRPATWKGRSYVAVSQR